MQTSNIQTQAIQEKKTPIIFASVSRSIGTNRFLCRGDKTTQFQFKKLSPFLFPPLHQPPTTVLKLNCMHLAFQVFHRYFRSDCVCFFFFFVQFLFFVLALSLILLQNPLSFCFLLFLRWFPIWILWIRFHLLDGAMMAFFFISTSWMPTKRWTRRKKNL